MNENVEKKKNNRITEFQKSIMMNREAEGEVAAIFSKEDELKCFFSGFSALIISELDCPQVRGGILTHNHVSDTAFSMHDLKTAAELDLIEIRVVGPSGWHSMKPGPEGWPSPLEISSAYDSVSGENKPAMGKERMKEESIRICERLSVELGMVYERGNFDSKEHENDTIINPDD